MPNEPIWKFSDRVGSAGSRGEVYSCLLDAVEDVCGARGCALFVQGAADALELVGSRNVSLEHVRILSALGPAAEHFEPLSGAENGERHLEGIVLFPLRYRDRRMGQLAVVETESLDRTGRRTVRFLADQTASAIERFRFEEELRAAKSELVTRLSYELGARRSAEERRAQLERLQSMSARLAGALSLEEVHRVVLEGGVDAVGAQDGAVLAVSLHALIVVRDSAGGTGAQIEVRHRHPALTAFRNREIVAIESPNVLSNRFPQLEPEALLVHGTAFVFVPLATDTVCVGVLALGFAEPRFFTRDEREHMSMMGSQAAMAIQRAQAFEQAERALRAREDVVALVSHDLRAPLSVIGIAATLLAEHPFASQTDRAEAEQHARAILRSVGRMERLVRDVLDFSRSETGRLDVPLGPQPILELLNQAIESARHLVRTTNIALRASEGSVDVLCDGERVLRVLDNLIGNAIKFTPEGGLIVVALETHREHVVITVEDFGAGIAAGDLPHIFDRYFQVTRERGPRGGVGLGLHIARTLVEAQGGRIWVESIEGKGSRFSFSLPRAKKARVRRESNDSAG